MSEGAGRIGAADLEIVRRWLSGEFLGADLSAEVSRIQVDYGSPWRILFGEIDRLTAAVDACLDNQEELYQWLTHGMPTGYDLEQKSEEQFQLTNRLRAVRGRPPLEPIVEWVSVERES